MDEREKEVIVKNLDKLVNDTICNPPLLASLRAAGVLGDDDVDVLNGLENNRSKQAMQLYSIVQKRQDAFESLLEGLNKTNQSGAVAILSCVQKRSSIDNTSISYEVHNVLGKGSYGTVVYKGKFGNRDVAVKKVHLDMFGGDHALHEVNVLRDCDVHENVVRYFGAKQSGDIILIALELCEMSLREWVECKFGDIPGLETNELLHIEVLRQVTVGLEWLHSQKIVHRDLKPKNVLIMQQLKRVKLSDFGLSRRILDGNSFVATENAGGTSGWMAPEILTHVDQRNSSPCKFTFASDVFALGCVYYYVMTDGKFAFGGAVSCQTNILEGKSMIKSTEMKHGCTQNLLFINLMISSDPKARPNCSTLLKTPLFWSSNDRVRFLDEIMERGDVFEEVKGFSTQDPCHFDHGEELRVLKGIGCPENQGIKCVTPFAYLRCNGQGVDSRTNSNSSVAEIPPKSTLKETANCASNPPPLPSMYQKPESFKKEEHKVVVAASGNSTFTSTHLVKNENVASISSAPISNLIQPFNKKPALSIQPNKITQGKNLNENKAKSTGDSGSSKSRKEKVEQLLNDLKAKNGGLLKFIKGEDSETIKGVLEKRKKISGDEKEELLIFSVAHREYDLVDYLFNNGYGSLLTKPVFNDSLIHECMKDIHKIDDKRFKEVQDS